SQNLGNYAAADLEYHFANQPLTFTNLRPDIPSLSVGHSTNHFSYNLSYLPLSRGKRFRPYATMGAGAVLYHISQGSKEDAAMLGIGLHGSWEFMFSPGGGLKYLVQDQFVLTLNVKDQISGVPSYGLPRFASVTNGFYQPGIKSSGLVNSWQISFGAVYNWDDF